MVQRSSAARKNDPDERGREAEKPSQVPWRGWKDVAARVYAEQSKDNLSIVAAGVAFYFILAMPAAIASAISLYGLVFDPHQVTNQLNALSGMMPQQAFSLVHDQLQRLTQNSGALSIGMAFGLLVTLWSATKGTKALITSLNIVYDEEEERSFIKLNLWALMLTILGIIAVLITLSLVVLVPAVVDSIGLPSSLEAIMVYVRWPLLAVMIILGLALIYRFAPDRDRPKWRWVSWGSVAGAVLWMLGSVLFSVYVSHFGNYNKTYGSMGAVIILMMWFYLSVYSILLGAEINSELEHQTRKDTTVGSPTPMGSRGAYVADTIGPDRRRIERRRQR